VFQLTHKAACKEMDYNGQRLLQLWSYTPYYSKYTSRYK